MKYKPTRGHSRRLLPSLAEDEMRQVREAKASTRNHLNWRRWIPHLGSPQRSFFWRPR